MSTESIINGYFGKVSTQGDFVSRGLPISFTNPWDAWLQEAVITSQQQLGDSWLNSYLTGPIYRFVLAPGVCGENGWLGVMMPSVDRIGRYYPMTIVTMNHTNINPFIALEYEKDWFTKVEALALSSLDEDFNLEQFNLELDALKSAIVFNNSGEMAAIDKHMTETISPAWQQAMKQDQSIMSALPQFLDNLLKEHCFAYSVWWTQGSEQVDSSLLICEGLPPFKGVAAMFDGQWKTWGWEGNRYPGLPFGS